MLIKKIEPLDDLLVLVKDRISGYVQNELYPSPAGGDATLDIYLIDIPSRGADPARPEGAPCIKLVPTDGNLGTQPAVGDKQRFAVQFVFFAADLDGRTDHQSGYNLVFHDAAEIIRLLLQPHRLGNWMLSPGMEWVYGKYVHTANGVLTGVFAAPYYHVTYVIEATKKFNQRTI
jgi:hypothetical protein